MEASIFLAKLIGPMLLLMGLFVVVQRDRMRRIGREFLDSEALIFISGVITLPAGLVIVITHNVWEPNWRVLMMNNQVAYCRDCSTYDDPDNTRPEFA